MIGALRLFRRLVDTRPVPAKNETGVRINARMVNTILCVGELHAGRPDGTCTCDPDGELSWSDCPTAIAVRQFWDHTT